ncbi:TFIIA-alpha and beta-like factor [Anolis sagrei]|uniref:TFIIA-alpha and beta-like factor n=1 Tax=Anolis sagrei TaxID=38937 RepID=UPI00352260EA
MEPEADKRGREEAMAHVNPMPKFYKSVMDDVIEGVRDVFMEEGVDEQVLKELQRRWESKLMQSKAMEGFFRHSRHVVPQFTLHLPHNFHQTPTGVAAVRGIRQFATSAAATTGAGAAVEPAAERGSSRTSSAFLTLPSGLAYPIQIPAGVTLQTASGHFYKVSMPVVVTQATGNGSAAQSPAPQTFHQPGKDPLASQSIAESPVEGNTASKEDSQAMKSTGAKETGMEEEKTLEEALESQEERPVGAPVSPQPCSSLETPLKNEMPRAAPTLKLLESDGATTSKEVMGGNPSVKRELPTNLEQALGPDDIIELIIMGNELDGSALLANEANLALAEELNPSVQMDPDMQAPKDIATDLKTIIQLDGTGDACPRAEVESPPVVGEDEELVGIIDADDLKVLDEEEDENSTSDNQSLSSASDADDPSVDITEEDPLNSGDDVSEQETPDVFDTDNIIVCQYDKVQRSKNRWKFYLKDGVMCFEGKDYVFSKAVGDAEW